ncbi:MAG: AI-2E family transporter [Erysipelotrichaceae bacterium]|jgi:predicted PurR-regulated permease PerM|nr:AI-2E family transporter [Erysipelotrichaceae bacterium]
MKIKDLMTDEAKTNMLSYAGAGCIIVLFYVLVSHLPVLGNGIKIIFDALSPFIYGFIFAFLVKPFRVLMEEKWLKKKAWSFKKKRLIATIFAMTVFILILVAFVAVLLPQLVASITSFVKSFSTYLENFEKLLNPDNASSPQMAELINAINSGLNTALSSISSWLTGASGGIQKILSAGMSLVKGTFNFLIGIIAAAYMLYDEEKFKHTFKKLFYGILPQKGADWIVYVYHLNKVAFNAFIFGKLIDSLIIGILCYICVAVMKMPYPVLIAVVVGVTNVIPVFGPFIGAIPCLIILVVIDPWSALKFLIFIFLLQQFDGNLLGPKILGGSLGLPTLWIMFAIIVGGSLFGIPGMVVGVPIFSVLCTLIRDWINASLKKKEIKME